MIEVYSFSSRKSYWKKAKKNKTWRSRKKTSWNLKSFEFSENPLKTKLIKNIFPKDFENNERNNELSEIEIGIKKQQT